MLEDGGVDATGCGAFDPVVRVGTGGGGLVVGLVMGGEREGYSVFLGESQVSGSVLNSGLLFWMRDFAYLYDFYTISSA